VGVERLPLFEAARSAPPGPPPWASERFEEPFVTAPLHRAGGPETSIKAARQALPSAIEQGKHIVSCLLGMGPVSADGSTGGGTAEEIAWKLNGESFDGPWNNVIVCRRISGLRLNHIYSYDGDEDAGRDLIERPGRRGRPMTVHEALVYRRRRAA